MRATQRLNHGFRDRSVTVGKLTMEISVNTNDPAPMVIDDGSNIVLIGNMRCGTNSPGKLTTNWEDISHKHFPHEESTGIFPPPSREQHLTSGDLRPIIVTF